VSAPSSFQQLSQRHFRRIPGERMQSSQCLSAFVRALFSAGLIAPLVGCGQEDPFPRHVVTGTVTYQGQNLEYGILIFEPRESIGKLAPVSSAAVRDGVFKTEQAEGPTTGEYRVKVLGYDRSGLEPDDTESNVPQLFPPYEVHVKLPTPDGTLDIEVPSRPPRRGR
jgi:hypothetical protein